jgi:hypothetical protein
LVCPIKQLIAWLAKNGLACKWSLTTNLEHTNELDRGFPLDLVLDRIGNIIVVREKPKLNAVDDVAGARLTAKRVWKIVVRTSTRSVRYLVDHTNIAHVHCLMKERGRGPVRKTPLNERL